MMSMASQEMELYAWIRLVEKGLVMVTVVDPLGTMMKAVKDGLRLVSYLLVLLLAVRLVTLQALQEPTTIWIGSRNKQDLTERIHVITRKLRNNLTLISVMQ